MKQKLKEIRQASIKLDFGCGINKAEGFTGIDSIKYPGVDVVMDVNKDRWAWDDNSIVEARASHFIEHLTSLERVHFVNELYRILAPKAVFQMVCPHWASCRAYGDPTHVWPPVSEFWFYYLSREWRAVNAPHTDIEHNPNGFDCNFNITWGYNLKPEIATRSQDYQSFAIANYKEACMDIVANFVKE